MVPWKYKSILFQGVLFAFLTILHQVIADCVVKGSIHLSGESFNISCREHCMCHGKTYGCISICPDEDIVPSKDCKKPRLIAVHGQCCKQWICAGNANSKDEDTISKDKTGADTGSKYRCPVYSSPWTQCSKTCGVGIATRVTGNQKCKIKSESKLCRLQFCDDDLRTT